jgi:putative FmdB family regulatory protein
MPTYEYKCPKCGNHFEKFQKISDNSRPKCPKCGTRAERLISGGAGLVFKGSGFYITDYKRAGQKDGGEESKPAAAEAKSADKPADKAEKTEQAPKTIDKPKKKPGAES